eukprot:TRINITY_DN6972_c0_g4_i1.p1 TRINITY_DN6972_c0_g4~~TRINITY_DN6972_c0_g4_i1.p1  ORF type:complete len:193 (-),score=48.80 TRINITY_DN6972_c0_g4_i1:113-613(-)
MEAKDSSILDRVGSPNASNGFEDRCKSRPSDEEYTNRSKLVSVHPPAAANMNLGLTQVIKNVDECVVKIKDLREYINLLKGDLTGLKDAAEGEISSVEGTVDPVRDRVMVEMKRFITEQQEEYFRLHKELCVLAKEKGEIGKELEKSYDKIHQMEEGLGIGVEQTL